MTRVTRSRMVVAMSGGVDSSVTAALLKEQGYQVIGVTLHLSSAEGDGHTCCTGRNVADARQVAKQISIPHYVLNYERLFFDQVVMPFVESYGRGETPVPCILCNKTIKFRDLLAATRLLGAESLATGHYVRKLDGIDRPELWRGRDSQRDQSYFLFATTHAQLSSLHFPLGELAGKAETRAHARRFGLLVADKPDSQDICFVPGGDYGRIVHTVLPDVVQPGDIVHIDGQILGRHPGIVYYTIGQRRGLSIGGAREPLYVVRLEPTTQRVVVGPRVALFRDQLTVREINWLGTGKSPPVAGIEVSVQLRSTQAPLPAMVYGGDDGLAQVILAKPSTGIAPGQACVFYQGDQVLGGGWIQRD